MKYSNSIKLLFHRNLLQLTLKCTVNWRMHQDSCLTTTEFHSAVKHKSVSEIKISLTFASREYPSE